MLAKHKGIHMAQERNGNSNAREWSEEERKETVVEANQLLEAGVDFRDLPDYFDNISLQTLKRWGVKSDRGNRLSFIQKKFCLQFIKTPNPSEAAKKMAEDQELLKLYPAIGTKDFGINCMKTEKVRKKIKELIEAEEVDVSMVICEYKKIGFFDARKMFNEDGSPKSVTELDDDTAGAISGIEVLEEWQGSGEDRVVVGHVKKYKISDKNKALDSLAKNLQMFAEKPKFDLQLTVNTIDYSKADADGD